jgi:hypothetical protein
VSGPGGETAGRAGDWAELHLVLLAPGERAPSLSADTARLPLEARVRGFLERDASPGEPAAVTTLLGRRVEGRLLRLQPSPGHSFGRPVVELLPIGNELRARLRGSGGPDA